MASVDDKLKTYRQKRDFKITSEPSPETPITKRVQGAMFMIHKHHASSLHYDLRLEMEGVLASWAIPKGPHYDPAVKHLAVQTEDHPLEYGNFEGRIPDGEYGAGDSLIWDRGVYETLPPGHAVAQREKGHLHLVFQGEKVKGEWHLVRTRPMGGKHQWIFFKGKDGLENPSYDVVAERPESVVSGQRTTRGPLTKKELREQAQTAKAHPQPEPAKAHGHKAAHGDGHAAPEVKLTSGDRVLFPRTKYAKRDVFEYYREVAPAMVQAMNGRPISFQQWPKGIQEEGFFRQMAKGAPAWATLVEIPHERRPVKHLVVDRTETLLWLANQSALTLHIWSSRLPHLDEPDWVVFDLDPTKDGNARHAWENLISVANALRGLLEELKLTSVPKTSGQRGLHVLVPIARGHTPEQTLEFATSVTEALEKGLPQLATTERTVKERKGRLYLDAFQNGPGRTLVAPYSIRPTENAAVSAPLQWSEVTRDLDPAEITIKTMPARLAKLGDLFAPVLGGHQRLPRFKDTAQK